jgi:hypothetical protein
VGPTSASSPPSPGVYAVALSGVYPRAGITWFQAPQECRLSGKRLLTNLGWQDAAAKPADSGDLAAGVVVHHSAQRSLLEIEILQGPATQGLGCFARRSLPGHLNVGTRSRDTPPFSIDAPQGMAVGCDICLIV